jgi:LysM repeat protein
MKRICFLLCTLGLLSIPSVRGQDAATEERLNKLAGQIEDMRAGQDALRKQFEALSHDIESLREQVGKPTGNYAGQEDLKRVAEAVKEVDRKRLEDYEKIRAKLSELGKTLSAAPPPKKNVTPAPERTEKANIPDKGFEYEVKQGDTLSIIVQAYRQNNIKVTTDQILKANPGLKAEKLRPGQKIFIPAPQT